MIGALSVLPLLVGACSSRDEKKKDVTTLPSGDGSRRLAVSEGSTPWDARLEQARELARALDAASVVQLLEDATLGDPSPPEEALELLAQAYVETGRFNDAELALQHGLRAHPSSALLRQSVSNLRFVIGKAKLEEGMYDDAGGEFRNALAAGPPDEKALRQRIAESYRDAARALEAVGDYNRAVSVLKASLELEPNNPPSIRLLGNILRSASRTQDAISFYELYLMYEPDDREMRQELVELHRELGNTAKADELLRGLPVTSDSFRAGDGAVERPQTRTVTEFEVRLAGASDPSEKARIHEEWGMAAAKEKDYRTAALELRRSLEMAPDNARVAVALAEVLRLDRKTAAARKVYEQLLVQNPGEHEARFQLAKLLVSSGHSRSALPHLRRLSLEPSMARELRLRSQNWLGITHAQLGDFDAAKAVWNGLLSLDPLHANAHYNLGQIHEKQQAYDQAIVSFEKAVEFGERDPDYLRYLERLGLAYRQVGRSQEAVDVWARLARAAPPGSPYEQKAREFLRRHGGERTVERVDPSTGRVVTEASSAPPPEVPLGWRRQDSQDEEPGRLSAELASGAPMGPEAEDEHLGRAEQAFDSGRIDEAIRHYELAIASNPGNGLTYFKLGDLLHEKGNREAEISLFQKMQRQSVTEDLRQAAIFRLQGLGVR